VITSLVFAALLAQVSASPSPGASPSAPPAECIAARAVRQQITYLDHIALTDAMLRHFRERHPKAIKGAFWIVTYLDGHVSARYADDPAYNDDFRNAIVAFGTHLKVTPTTPGCDGIGAVFVMVFTIPDGRVRLVPVKPPHNPLQQRPSTPNRLKLVGANP
jgi:hypothetical protein